MHSEFAYSGDMQLILMFFAYFYNFILFYFISNIIMKAHNEKAAPKQKILFAFLNGCVMYTGFSYFIYYIGDMVSFSSVKYLLVVSPNPIMSLIYCFLGIKILHLSSVRSIELMGDVYLYNAIFNSIARLIGAIFFVRDPSRCNYLLDFIHLAVCLAVFIFVYWGTCFILSRKPNFFAPNMHMLVNPKKDLCFFLLKASVVYLAVVVFPLIIPNQVVAHMTVSIILTMMLVCSLINSNYRHMKAMLYNNELHIDSLIKASDEFRSVKYDFYNILQTYNGYFAMGNFEGCKRYHDSLVKVTLHAGESLELNHRLNDHPVLISLLMQKRERARQLNVDMEISIKCMVSNLPLNDIDIGRVISCLLDNAIEAASESEQRRLSFAMEQKTQETRLIIITNSTNKPLELSEMLRSGVTTKEGHQGIGLNNVRNVINKYANCSFQMNYLNHEMVAYIELKQSNWRQ